MVPLDPSYQLARGIEAWVRVEIGTGGDGGDGLRGGIDEDDGVDDVGRSRFGVVFEDRNDEVGLLGVYDEVAEAVVLIF